MAQVRRKVRRRMRPGAVAFFILLILTALFFTVYSFTRPEDSEKDNDPNIENVGGEKKENVPEESPDAPDEPVLPELPDEPQETRLTFVAFGDNLIHSSIIDDGERLADEHGTGKQHYFDPMYENFKDIVSSADIAFINQETPIAGPSFPYAGYPNFNTPEEMGDCLIRLGFDVINTATNHMLDCRGKGLVYHADYWAGKADENVIQVGSYKNKADYDRIRVYEKDGVKIAFLAYTYSTNGMTPGAGYEDIYIPLIDDSEMKRQVAEAKELADLVFVSMHWGMEDSFDTIEGNGVYDQRNAAQTLVDAGVDVIIGTHPHVVQEMKWKTNAQGHETLLVYSLGNFISTMYYPWNMFGGYLSCDIVKDENGAHIENPYFNPTMCHYSMQRRALKMYTLEEYSQELYETHGTTLKSSAYSYDKIVKKIKDVIPEEFLTDYFKNYGE